MFYSGKGVSMIDTQISSPGLHVWFSDDIRNTLRAVDTANAEVFKVINAPEMQLYRQGYEAALRSIAEAFGIQYALPVDHDRGNIGNCRGDT